MRYAGSSGNQIQNASVKIDFAFIAIDREKLKPIIHLNVNLAVMVARH